MACLGHICQESEYEAINKKKKHKYVGGKDPGEDKCLKVAKDCEDQAEKNLDAAVKALNEKLECQGDCDCFGKGPLGKWQVIGQNLIWKQDILINNCKWEITITYDLQYRESTPPGKCVKKPPKSPL